jgi:hypothetical protein
VRKTVNSIVQLIVKVCISKAGREMQNQIWDPEKL